MGTARWLVLGVASLLFVSSSPAFAADRDDDSGGPAFCRSGAGHPVYGWEWCRDRGWDRVNGRGVLRAQTRPVYDQRRDDRVYRGDDRVYRGDNRRSGGVAFDNGYADGYEKGLNDARDRHAFDPTRHKWYRSGERNYDSRYGSRAQYANVYRDGFRRGYESAYADNQRYGDRRVSRFPRPF